MLALEQYGAGPFATSQLVDLGAEVIKIEDPSSGGDVARSVPPYASEDSSLFFETFNRGKLSVTLDLENSAGRQVFEGLVARSDVVFANVRGDVPAKLGLRYEDLRFVNEKIVCCFLTSYGIASSEQEAPGYDYVMQGRAGGCRLLASPMARLRRPVFRSWIIQRGWLRRWPWWPVCMQPAGAGTGPIATSPFSTPRSGCSAM